MKTCSKCKTEKPFEQFPPRKETPDGRGYICRQCIKAYAPGQAARVRERYANDPEFRARRKAHYQKWYAENGRAMKDRMRSYRRHYKYGMTIEDYDRMFAEQNGGCAICGGTPTRTEHLHVDHDHETGRIRGLLCDSCNLGLGKFRDDPDVLAKAAAYLRSTTP